MKRSVSKSRSKKSKQRDKEDIKKRGKTRNWSLTGVLLGALLWLSGLSLLYVGGKTQYKLLNTGQKSSATVISAVEFSCVDIARTAYNRQQVRDAVPPVFALHYETLNANIRDLDKLFDKAVQLRADLNETDSSNRVALAMGDVLDLLGIPLKATDLLQLLPDDKIQADLLQTTIKDALRKVWARGIVSASEKETAFDGIAGDGLIRVEQPDGALSAPIKLGSLLLPATAMDETIALIRKEMPDTRLPDASLRLLLAPGITPNLTYNLRRTNALKDEAEKNVPPVKMTVRAGTTLIEEGERITPAILEQLRAYNKRLQELETPMDRMYRMIGDGSMLMLALVVAIGLLKIINPDILMSRARILLVIILSLLTLLPTKGLLYLADTTQWISPSIILYCIPIALTPLLTTILLDSGTAMVVGFWTSFATAMLLGHSFPAFTVGLLVTTVAAHAAQGIHRRSRVFRAGLWVGLAEILCALTLAVMEQQTFPGPLLQAVTGLFNGLLCAFLTLLFIPLFELLFKITTDITLLELSDLSNPLLQRLAMEAPGTYHHSLMVASLAQAAAQEIGANGLLVRVGAYFHDIGKLTKPEFFIENAQFRDNPHDDLSPSMSTLVVTSHVKEGVTLAMRHKLPQIVIDAIQQHHGSGLVSYFYHRARQQQEEGENGNTAIQEQDFRYPGPRPHAREMAILALADSVEAASRSMDKPTASRIENLVNDIVDNKMHDHQLDECDLTLAQLAAIKRSFVFSLTNMLHGRIAYPQDETRNKQSAKKAPNGSGTTPKPPATPDGTSAGD
ncbi:MAG: HDIG domain-containing protein [Spartobacteria bacterium]|nr:HDIG domain-containing protein [Spartobacteria bacterium]